MIHIKAKVKKNVALLTIMSFWKSFYQTLIFASLTKNV